MLDVAQKMARATGKKFTYGLAYYLNDYPADGTIFDYMAGVRKVKLPYLFISDPHHANGSIGNQSRFEKSNTYY